METKKLIAIYLPILAIVTTMIVTTFFNKGKLSKKQRNTVIVAVLAGFSFLILLTLSVI